MLSIVLPLAALLTSIAGSYWYRRFALRRGIIAKINTRTLHERTVPRGGGIVFSMVFCLGTLVAYASGALTSTLALALGVGGAAAAIVGFVDDVHELRPLTKLALQAAIGAWLAAVIAGAVVMPYVAALGPAGRIGAVASVCFVPLWLMNMYNFIDGIDGMAIIGAVFVCSAAIIVLSLTTRDPALLMAFAVLGASGAGFLIFNVPPASMFMGDAGSMFLGYCFAALLLVTVGTGDISIWTWLAILSYFIADTTTTTLWRMAFVKKWYGVHRSHAYQNLARITKSHATITYGVALHHLLWALPLAVWSAVAPHWGPVAALLALAPAVGWTLRFGPRLSSD